MDLERIIFCKRNIRIDYSGHKFNKLSVLFPVGKCSYKTNETLYLCECDCGNFVFYTTTDFKTNISCGCHRREQTINRNLKHGMYHTKERSVWQAMKRRCYNKNSDDYKEYGGRGITVCDRWLDDQYGFLNFYEDMGKRPKGKSIDRIDNNSGYSPDNCEWRTLTEQGRNKRNNINITYKGKTQCLSAWSEELNKDYKLLHSRLKYQKWSVERTFEI